MGKITELLDKFRRIFNKKLSEQVDIICFDDSNQITDELGYGYVKDYDGKIGLYILYMGEEWFDQKELEERLQKDRFLLDFLGNEQGFSFDDLSIEFVHYILNDHSNAEPKKFFESPKTFYTYVDSLKGTKNLRLLDVTRIWNYDELIAQLYFNVKTKLKKEELSDELNKGDETFQENTLSDSIDEDVLPDEKEDPSSVEDDVQTKDDTKAQEERDRELATVLSKNMDEYVNKWNASLVGTPLQLIHMKLNVSEDAQLKAKWQEWYDYFWMSTWRDVFLLYDEDLHTGTLILFDIDQKYKKNLPGSIAKDVSWALFQVLSSISADHQNGEQIKLHSLSCVVVDEITEDQPDAFNYKGNIISGLEQRSDLLHEVKITLLNKMHMSSKHDIWIRDYLANHLIPFRNKDVSDFRILKDKVRNIKATHLSDLQVLWTQLHRFEGKELNSDPKVKKNLDVVKSIIKGLLATELEGDPTPLERIQSIFMGIKQFTEKPVVLDLKENVNIIFAPNGYGKSSIVEGIKCCTILKSEETNPTPLWNVWHEEPGVFGLITKYGKNLSHRMVFQNQDQKAYVKKSFLVNPETQEEYSSPEDLNLNLRLDQFKTFCFSGESEVDFNNNMLNLLMSKLMNISWTDVEQSNLLKKSKFENREVYDFFTSFVKKMWEIQKEVGKVIKEELVDPLLTTFVKVMTSESWLYDFKFHFSSEKGLKMGSQNKDGSFDIDQIINLGEQKVINLAVFFLLYYLEGYRYSQVVILDDIFATFDEKQCYNFLRFLMLFRNLPRIKGRGSQFIVLSHRKPIFDYFYYNTLTYLNKNSNKNVAGYYNFVLKEDIEDTVENYTKYMQKLQGSEKGTERKLYQIRGKVGEGKM